MESLNNEINLSPKKKSKTLLLFFIGTASAIGIVVGVSAYLAFIDLPMVNDINSCFETKMFHVKLCPSSPSYVRYNQIPKSFINALIASEDAAFWGHEGFDLEEMKESFRKNILEGKIVRGGSTLTQQLAKNLYLEQDKSLIRKFRELFLAQKIEKILSKTQILEKYANVVEFGENIYGISNASRKYFGVAPSQLNFAQSIYLVSLLPNPKSYAKSFYTKKLNRTNTWRMKLIADRLLHYGKMTDEEYQYVVSLIEGDFWHPVDFDVFRSQKQHPEEDPQDARDPLDTEIQNEMGGTDTNTLKTDSKNSNPEPQPTQEDEE